MTDSNIVPRLFGDILPYEAEVAEPNGPRIVAWVLADYSDRCQKYFETWLAEHDQQVAANAWEEGYTEGVRGRIWDSINPYRADEKEADS